MKVKEVKLSDIAKDPNLSLAPEDYIEKEKRYTVSVEVNGVIDVAVSADSPEEAKEKANDVVCSLDFGDISFVEWRPVTAEDIDGNVTEY